MPVEKIVACQYLTFPSSSLNIYILQQCHKRSLDISVSYNTQHNTMQLELLVRAYLVPGYPPGTTRVPGHPGPDTFSLCLDRHKKLDIIQWHCPIWQIRLMANDDKMRKWYFVGSQNWAVLGTFEHACFPPRGMAIFQRPPSRTWFPPIDYFFIQLL